MTNEMVNELRKQLEFGFESYIYNFDLTLSEKVLISHFCTWVGNELKEDLTGGVNE